MPEFFLELFSEEIPARMQSQAAGQLEELCSAAFQYLNINWVDVFFGPRRIAIKAQINSTTVAKSIRERGPRESAPEAALTGFLGKHSATREETVIEYGYYVLHRTTSEISAEEVILKELASALEKFAWPKSMRWGGSGDFVWVRPLRRIVCLLDGKLVPLKFGPITASNETEGHRVLSPGVFAVSLAMDWEEKLKLHYVIADQNKRRQIIVDGINKKATGLGLSVAEDDGLIDEVNGLVEWPITLIGKIDEKFMDLPWEVRELSMKVNQKYFALRDADGKPAPYFAFVSNLEAPDGGAAIIAGNERVLRARLSDARHFWDLDLKTPLNELLPKLEKITFHAKIGTQLERSERIAKRAKEIAVILGADEYQATQAEWAGRLCKADLVSGMVGQFPELQGIMGGYYAEKNPRAWDGSIVGPAIKTHYQPKGPSDDVPTGIVAVSVALADKLYTLVEFFRNNEKPTGSGDPYALRRAALGVIRINLENKLSKFTISSFISDVPELFTFVLERLRVKLKSEGQRFDILDAAMAIRAEGNLLLLMERVDSVSELIATEDGSNLLAAYRRAANILRIENDKDGPHGPNVITANLILAGEQNFWSALKNVKEQVENSVIQGDYKQAIKSLATLRAPVDAFFENITVNDTDPKLRLNRLALLAQLRDTMHQIADFSKIEG